MASLLLGYPASGIIQNTPQLAYGWLYYALYVQDDIKITNKLTVNAGLRWDVEGSPQERYDRMNAGFGFGQTSPLASAVKNANTADCPACANLTGGLLFVNTNGLGRATVPDPVQPSSTSDRSGLCFTASHGDARRIWRVLSSGICIRRFPWLFC